MTSLNLDSAIEIREDFYDAPHTRKKKVSWKWPKKLYPLGSCEAILYTSNKWQKDGSFVDYKHVSEAPQKLFISPRLLIEGDSLRKSSSKPLMPKSFPDGFAVLAKCIAIQAKCGKEFFELKFPKNSMLGAGKFKNGKTFCFIYNSDGVLALVTGKELEVLKDGIVG
jgi:hypothetical protein